MKNEHSSELRDDASGVDPKGTWLELVWKTPTKWTIQNTWESNATTATSEPNNTTSTITKSTTPPGPKHTITQQICALKESMTEEEHSMYLNKWDTGEGFHYAEL